MNKRYFVFGFSHFYPSGGMNDCRLKSSDFKEVLDFVKNWATVEKGAQYENLHVYDSEKDEMIYSAHYEIFDYMDNDARALHVKFSTL